MPDRALATGAAGLARGRRFISGARMLAFAFFLACQAPMPSEARYPSLDALPLSHFPPRQCAEHWALWCRDHAEWAESQVTLYPSEVRVAEYARLARWKANVWSLLANAHGEQVYAIWLSGGWYGWPRWSEAMELLEDEIGPENFALGRMPTPWP